MRQGLVTAGLLVAALAAVGAWAPATGPVAPGVRGPALVATPHDTARGPSAVAGPATGTRGDHEGVARLPPVDADPVRWWEPPPHDYGPGHRGVDLPVPDAGQPLVAPQDGTVVFAGPVAGRGVVVVAAPDGRTRHSLEPATALLAVGQAVRAGEAVAVTTSPVHPGCLTACVHWGVRVDGRYVDPWWWLGRAGPVVLLPQPVRR